MTSHTSRAERLRQIERQIGLVDFQLASYLRHEQHALADAARAAGRALRLRWLETHYGMWCWKQKRATD